MTVERAEETEPTPSAAESAAPVLDPEPSADPSPEAAIGSGGARALGGASEVAARVESAVGALREGPEAAGTEEQGEPSGASDGDAAPMAVTAADVTAGDGRDAAPEAGTGADGTGAPEDGTGAPEATAAVTGDAGADGSAAPDPSAPPAATAALSTEGSAEATTPTTDDAPVDATSAPEASAAPEAPTNGAAAPAADPLSADELAQAPAAEPAAPPAAPRPEPTTMEELLSEQSGDIRSFKHGDVVEGAVVRIDKDEILVDIGAKSEGVVSNRELYGRHAESQPQLNVGDTVLVYVLQPESEQGHAVLSLRRAGLERKWRAMQEQFDAGVIIEAPVIDHNKGGLIVDCGIRGFVPISQIVDFPRRPQNEQPRDAAQEIAEKLQPFVGRRLRLKILEVNRKANRLILSEKVALYEERREKRDELFSSLKVGQRVTGSVRSIAPFGVFVDLGGIDGLVHKSELSWNKVNNPENGYKVGEEVEAEVIDINHERGRISLSIRRLQPDPWHSTVADLKAGDLIEGAVTKIVNFGAFVRVREGLEGLIHISELSHQRVAHPGDVVHEGQRLKLKIISLDSERHRLGLSLKQAEEAPARPPMEAPQPRERRSRPERAYDPSQAVQEPEGGIDNTLAAAFAQVRQQMQESESRATDEDTASGSDNDATAGDLAVGEDAAPTTSGAADDAGDAGDAVGAVEDAGGTVAAPPSDETIADVLRQTPETATVPEPETADAPALEAGSADASATAEPADTDAAPVDAGTPSEDAPAAATTDTDAETTDTDAGTPPDDAPAAETTDTDAETAPAEPGAPADDAAIAATPDGETGDTPDGTAGTVTDASETSGEAGSAAPSEGGPGGADDGGSRDPAEGAPEAAPDAGADTER